MIEYSQDAPFDALERIREKQPLNHEYELSEDDLIKLSELNSRLVKIEKLLLKEAEEAIKYANQKVDDAESSIEDFEMDLFVYFGLNEDEFKYYDEYSDNLIMSLYQGVTKSRAIYALADGNNHSDFTYQKHHPMFGEEHCWLFHALYDHSQLSFEEILKISEVYFSVKLELQWGWDG